MPQTRFVKSLEQIRSLQEAFATPAFLQARTLAVTFETDPAIVAELLPPPLAPAANPRVAVSVSVIGESNCVGPFNGAAINISCTYGGVEGLYCLTMPMDTDTAVIVGRELYAEPKKLAAITLDGAAPGHVRGSVTRHGVTYIDLRASFEDGLVDVGRESLSSHYYFKFMPSADGTGFAHDPELIRVTHRGVTHRVARGAGTITFRESRHDPVIDIPVLSVTGATYSEGETHTRAEVVTTVPGEQFLPYAFGKMDDLTAWALAAVSV